MFRQLRSHTVPARDSPIARANNIFANLQTEGDDHTAANPLVESSQDESMLFNSGSEDSENRIVLYTPTSQRTGNSFNPQPEEGRSSPTSREGSSPTSSDTSPQDGDDADLSFISPLLVPPFSPLIFPSSPPPSHREGEHKHASNASGSPPPTSNAPLPHPSTPPPPGPATTTTPERKTRLSEEAPRNLESTQASVGAPHSLHSAKQFSQEGR